MSDEGLLEAPAIVHVVHPVAGVQPRKFRALRWEILETGWLMAFGNFGKVTQPVEDSSGESARPGGRDYEAKPDRWYYWPPQQIASIEEEI